MVVSTPPLKPLISGANLVAATGAVEGFVSHEAAALWGGIKHLPGDVEQGLEDGMQGVEDVLPSEYLEIPGPHLGYETLNPGWKQAAVLRGAGQTVAQQQTTSSADGGDAQEPISIVYHGTLQDLKQALESQGWHAPRYPMSTSYHDGQPAALSLSNHETISRDHLRVYHLGHSSWGISATQDVKATISTPGDGHGFGFGHLVDPHIDKERDQVMVDLLKASPQARHTWRVVQGTDRSTDRSYETNGQIYEISF